jgi:hypothetical protein
MNTTNKPDNYERNTPVLCEVWLVKGTVRRRLKPREIKKLIERGKPSLILFYLMPRSIAMAIASCHQVGSWLTLKKILSLCLPTWAV